MHTLLLDVYVSFKVKLQGKNGAFVMVEMRTLTVRSRGEKSLQRENFINCLRDGIRC